MSALGGRHFQDVQILTYENVYMLYKCTYIYAKYISLHVLCICMYVVLFLSTRDTRGRKHILVWYMSRILPGNDNTLLHTHPYNLDLSRDVCRSLASIHTDYTSTEPVPVAHLPDLAYSCAVRHHPYAPFRVPSYERMCSSIVVTEL